MITNIGIRTLRQLTYIILVWTAKELAPVITEFLEKKWTGKSNTGVLVAILLHFQPFGHSHREVFTSSRGDTCEKMSDINI